jgi:hypothetical protein
MQGFPVLCGVAMDSDWMAAIGTSAYDQLQNLLQHELLRPQFATLGFDPSEFTGPPPSPGDISLAVNDCRRDLVHPHRWHTVRGRWNWYYFLQRLTERVEPHYAGRSAAVLEAGRQLFPSTMDDDAQWMREWFEAGQWKSTATYGPAFNDFCRTVGLPPVLFGRLSAGIRSPDFVLLNP